MPRRRSRMDRVNDEAMPQLWLVLVLVAAGIAAIWLTLAKHEFEAKWRADHPPTLATVPKPESRKPEVKPKTQREIWAEKYPDVRKVLSLDPQIDIIHYKTGYNGPHWQIMDGLSRAVCPDGGYGKTVQAAAADCLAHPGRRFPVDEGTEY